MIAIGERQPAGRLSWPAAAEGRCHAKDSSNTESEGTSKPRPAQPEGSPTVPEATTPSAPPCDLRGQN